MRTFVALVGLLMVAMSVQAQAPRSNETIPYIYYFSLEEQALIIERADGGDRHLIAQDAVPPLDNWYFFRNVDWSPSGQWVSWELSAFNAYGGFQAQVGWVTHVDGTQPAKPFSEKVTTLTHLEWSPVADLLLVQQFNWGDSIIDAFVYDPMKQETIVSARVRIPATESWGSAENDVGWANDGSYVFFWGAGITKLYLDGRSDTYFVTDYWDVFSYDNGIVVSSTWGGRRQINNGQLVVLTDLRQSKEFVLDTFEWNNQPTYEFFWQPGGYKGLFSRTTCQNEHCATQWQLIDLITEQTHAISSLYMPADTTQAPPSPRFNGNLWSEDGRYFLMMDTNRAPVIFDTYNMLFRRISAPPLTAWEWKENILLLPVGNQLKIIDPSAQVMDMYPSSQGSLYSFPEVSPDGRFFHVWNDQVVLLNLQTNEQQTWLPHSGNTVGGSVTGVNWSSDSQWFFSGGNVQTVDSCCLAAYQMIHQVGTPERRELGVCLTVETCTGFLPDRVLPHLGEATPDEQPDDD